jgi:hypothetical protein
MCSGVIGATDVCFVVGVVEECPMCDESSGSDGTDFEFGLVVVVVGVIVATVLVAMIASGAVYVWRRDSGRRPPNPEFYADMAVVDLS